MGGDERAVPTPAMNPRALRHEVLKSFTDAADPAGSTAVADTWGELASRLDKAAELFQRAVSESEAGWTGEAADAMRAQLARVVEWTRQTGAHYQATSAAIAAQSGVAESAKSAMPPPVPYDPAQMIRDARASGDILRMASLPFQMYAQKQLHDAAHEEAVRVVTERDRAFSAAAGQVPAFAAPPSVTDGHSGGPAENRSATGVGVAGPVRPLRHTVGQGTVGRSAVGQSAPVSGTRSGSGQPPGGPASGPPLSAVSASSGPVTGSDPVVAPAHGFPGTAASGFGPESLPGGGFGPGGPSATTGTVASSAAGFGPNGSPGPAGPVGLSGPPAGGLPAQESHGAAGMAGRPVGARRGKAAKDIRRKRPEYLIEPEPEGMFGSDQLTSPPVIGQE